MTTRILVRLTVAGLTAAIAMTVGCDQRPRLTDPTPMGLTVSSIAPSSAPYDTPAVVHIYGTGFQPGAIATVNGVALNIAVLLRSSIVADVPALPAGVYDVVVSNPDGESRRLGGAYRSSGLMVTSFSHRQGIIGESFTITGTGIKTGATVAVDGVPSPNLRITPNVDVTFEAPSHALGMVDVTVTNPDGQSITVENAFTYQLVSISVGVASVVAGSPISASWVAPNGRPDDDWVGLFRAGLGSEGLVTGTVRYTQGAATGVVSFPAPAQPGTYEVRYLAGYFPSIAAARSSVVVVTAPEATNRRFAEAAHSNGTR